jgi:hypothetical protein
VFKLEFESIWSVKICEWCLRATNTIDFGRLFHFGILLVNCDGATILMIFRSRIDELEGDGGRTGHGSEGEGEITGGMGGRKRGWRTVFYWRRGKVILKEARELRSD